MRRLILALAVVASALLCACASTGTNTRNDPVYIGLEKLNAPGYPAILVKCKHDIFKRLISVEIWEIRKKGDEPTVLRFNDKEVNAFAFAFPRSNIINGSLLIAREIIIFKVRENVDFRVAIDKLCVAMGTIICMSRRVRYFFLEKWRQPDSLKVSIDQ